MKFRTTQKAIKNGYNKVISIPYCNLQTLLKYVSPIAYTVGSYGWNADIYQFGCIAVVTGYSPFGNVKPNYETVKKYEDQAREIDGNYNINWEDKPGIMGELISKFLDEVC